MPSHSDLHRNRREFILQASALSVTTALSVSAFAQSSTQSDSAIDLVKIQKEAANIPGRDTTLKFDATGNRRPFAGNTVICHLPVQCAMRDGMVALHDELVNSPFHRKLGLTSTDSYHMTVFPGANDQDRSASGWPSYVPIDASIEECSRLVGERMAQCRLSCELPIRVKVDLNTTLNYFAACTLRLMPADDSENTKLRSVRDKLADVYGFRTKGHDQYAFHMTMSYQIARFTDDEQKAYRKVLQNHIPRIIAAAPIQELGMPEYCTFPDMFRFEPKKLLICS